MALVARDAFPTFALGEWFDDMKRAAADHPAPSHLAWIAEDAILLAPRRTDPDHWIGYLVVMDEAAGQLREFQSEDGRREWMIVPASVGSEGAVEAHVEISLRIVESGE